MAEQTPVAAEQLLAETVAAPDWDAIRIDYEKDDQTLAELEAKWGITKHELNKRRLAEAWRPRRRTVASRAAIVARIYRILDRRTEQMERDLDKGDQPGLTELNSVTRTLEKLIALNKGEDKLRRKPRESEAMKTLRLQLADRLGQLNQG